MTTFTAEGAKALKTFPQGRRQFLDAAKKLRIKVVAEHVRTGKYGMFTVLDAPDLESILKLSAMMAASGRTRNETHSVVSADEFERISPFRAPASCGAPEAGVDDSSTFLIQTTAP